MLFPLQDYFGCLPTEMICHFKLSFQQHILGCNLKSIWCCFYLCFAAFLNGIKARKLLHSTKAKRIITGFSVYESFSFFGGGGLEDYLQALCVPVGSLWLQSLSESCKNTRSNPTLISSFANVIFCRATGFSFLLTLSLQGLCGWCNDHFHSVSCNFTWPCFLHAFMWWLHDQNAK